MMKRFLSIVAALCGILTGSAGQINVESPILATNGVAIVEIVLCNEHTDLVAFQMDLTLPEGIALDKAGCHLSSRITDEGQTLTIGKLESGFYRLTSASLSLKPFSGTDGTLLFLNLTTEEGLADGKATISNIIFSTADSQRMTMDDVSFDITIYNTYKLSYLIDGEEYLTDSVIYNTPLTPIADPAKEGYTFNGWDEVPEIMPAHDVTVNGSFTVNKYKVRYYVGDQLIAEDEVEYGAEVVLRDYTPEDATRYTFIGWEGEKYETMPAHDIEYQANIADGINELMIGNLRGVQAIHDANGRNLSKIQSGVIVLLMRDGTRRKVVVK